MTFATFVWDLTVDITQRVTWAVAPFIDRSRRVSYMNVWIDPPEPAREWEEEDWCHVCDEPTMHLWVKWQPNGEVSGACTECGNEVAGA